MIGTPSQIEWAEEIKPRVSIEFDRVAQALLSTPADRNDQDKNDVLALISILEGYRSEVLEKDHAGYFIQNWREPGDRVRNMILQDSRYQEIHRRRKKQLQDNRSLSSPDKLIP